VFDLQGDAADMRSDNRFGFPKRFGDRQPKSFFKGFLDDDVGGPLEGIDKNVVLRQEKNMDIRVFLRFFLDFSQDLRTFGVVRSCPPCQDELAVDLFFYP